MADLRFDGKIAVVTGGGSGLGRAYSLELAAQGAFVIINDLPPREPTETTSGAAESVAEEIRQAGGRAESAPGDLTDEHFATSLINDTVQRHGRIDILINNAGVTAPGSIYDATTESVKRLWDVNFWSSFWTMQAAVRHMKTQGTGRIVNTSSGFGMFGAPDRIGYATSKAAVSALTKAAALDAMEDGIAVNAICPIAYTPMSKSTLESSNGFDPARFETSRVVPVVLFLAHEACPFTGEVLSAGADTWARIFTAKTAGVHTKSDSIEEVFSQLDSIMDFKEFTLMRASSEQLREGRETHDGE